MENTFEVTLNKEVTTAITNAKISINDLQEKIKPLQIQIEKLNSGLTSFLIGISLQNGYGPLDYSIALNENDTKLIFTKIEKPVEEQPEKKTKQKKSPQ